MRIHPVHQTWRAADPGSRCSDWAIFFWSGCFCAWLCCCGSTLAAQLPLKANVQIEALQAEKANRTLSQRKLDSQFLYACREHRGERIALGLDKLRSQVRHRKGDRVLADVRAEVTPRLLEALRAGGATVLNSYPQHRTLRAWIPLPLLEPLAELGEVDKIQPGAEATTNVGSVTSQADATHLVAAGRKAYELDGQGVKIGVLSDGVTYLAESQARGDLPAVTILPGQAGVSDTGEGTAMLELIHDLAPGAELYFATAFASAASFAENIRSLHAAGCRIIVDDVTYFDESPFQDGIISQAVNDVSAAGTLYFSSAGNSGNKNDGTSSVWEGDFQDGGAASIGRGGRLHSFGSSTVNPLLPGGGFRRVDLHWNDPLGKSGNDYDVYVLDPAGNVVASSSNVQNGNDDPYESIGTLGAGDRIVVVKFAGAARYLRLSAGRAYLTHSTPGITFGHNASGASNAFSVAATWVRSGAAPFVGGSVNPVETFSSGGPRRMFYHPDGTELTPGNLTSSGGIVLQKPDITAADGVSTSVPGFETFFGTSAAAPHAAAIAALLWSYNPSLSPSEVRAALVQTALDIEAPGPDVDSGAGIVMLPAAIEAAATPPPKLLVDGAQISEGNNNGLVDANECNRLFISLRNGIGPNGGTARDIQVTLRSLTAGVTVDPAPVSFPDIPASESRTNGAPFSLASSASFVCGSGVVLELSIRSGNAGIVTRTVHLDSPAPATGPAQEFASQEVPRAVPDGGVTDSSVSVSGITVPVARVQVSLHLQHAYVSDLILSLIGPDGTEVELSNRNGNGGQNYGTSCSARTVFEDTSSNELVFGTAPFVGTFRPQSPLSRFQGKSGSQVNGTWMLRVRDVAEPDTGTIQCWSLILSPIECVDGGGACFAPPAIVSQPLPVTTTNGYPATFRATVTGTAPLAYQWFYQATNPVSAAFTDTLTFSAVNPDLAGFYSLVATNRYGAATSSPVALTVLLPPSIVAQPESVSPTNGGSATFTVLATGTAPLAYQWFRGAQPLPSATSATLVIPSVTLADSGSYTVRITNPYGTVLSTPASLAVVAPPVFVTQPRGAVTNPGAQVTLSALVEGSAPIDYQWFFNEDTPIAGATNASLTLRDLTSVQSGAYSLVATNPYGRAVSDQAILEVRTPNQAPTISLLSPLNGAAYVASNLPIILSASANDADGTVQKVRYSVNGLALAESTSSPYTFEWVDPTPGTHVLEAVAVDDRNQSSLPATAQFTVTYPASTALRLVSAGSVWRYLDDGSDQGTNWSTLGFNDEAWPAGPAELGYGDAAQGRPEATLLNFGPAANSKHITYYFRKTFTLADAGAYTNLQFRLMRDDAARVYLNGQEVYRVNLPEGEVDYLTLSTANVNGNAESQFFATNASPAFLQDGTNLVAVEIHQENQNSSDISFDLELHGMRNPAPRLLTHPEDTTVDAGQAAEFTVSARGAPPLSYQWYFRGDARLNQATGSVLTLPSVSTNLSGLYSVVVSNTFGSVTSTPARLVVVPFIVNQPPTLTLTSPELQAIVSSDQLPLRIAAAALDPEGEPLRVEFLADGAVLATLTAPPYEIEWVDPTPQVHSIWAIATDPQGLSVTSAVAQVRVDLAASGYYRILKLGSVWKYNDQGLDLGIEWRSPDYDDRDWAEGPAELGYGDAAEGRPEATLIQSGSSATQKHPTAYFRRAVVISDASALSEVRLSLQRDDGAAVYLNGQEILRENLPAGDLSFTNLAVTTIGGAAETNLVVTILPSAPLRNGLNVLAVEMHQVNRTSTDLSFDLQLEALRLPLPQITEQPRDLTVTNGATALFSVTATGSQPLSYQWLREEGIPIPGQTERTLRLNSVTIADSGVYRCVVSNAFGSALSSNAVLTVVDPALNKPPVVTLNAPADGAVFDLGQPLSLQATATDRDGQVTRVEFWAGGSRIGSDTDAPYAVSWQPNLPGEYQLAALATDNFGKLGTSAPVKISVIVPTRFTASLVSTGSIWRYLDTGVDQGSTWRRADFNDQGWPLGRAILGYGNAPKGRPESTLLGFGGDPNNRYPTYYFRRTFVVTNAASISRLEYALLRDDGASIYLNGTRVVRDNLPAGGVSFNVLASTPVVDGDETRYFTNETATALLVNGTNTLAVEVHQVSRTSDDLAFDLGLTAILNTPPVILSQPDSLTVTNGDPASFRIIAVGTGTLTYQWFFNGVAINNATAASLNFAAVGTNRAGVYSVNVRNNLGTTRSSNATLRVIVPPPNIRPEVALLTPTNGATFLQTETIGLTASANDPDGSIAFVDFYAGTTALGRVLQPPYLFDWRNAPTGFVTLRALAVDNRGATNLSAPATILVRPLPAPPTLDVTLISTGSVWKYLDTGVDQGTAWKEPDFEDGSWPSGPAELGYGDTTEGRPEATVLEFGGVANRKHITYYFRQSFLLENSGGFSNLTVHLMRDDGGVVYLNGTEVFRSNMPTGAVVFGTLANGAVNKLNESTFFTNNINPSLLRNGTNWVAVEIHQSAPESSDISFDLALTGIQFSSPIIITQPRDLSVSAGSRAEFSVTAVGAPPLSYQWYANRLNLIPDATNSSLIIPSARTADEGNYSVVVSNPQGQVRSSSAILEVLSSPTILSQPRSQTVDVGGTAEFTVEAVGTPDLVYQWFYNGNTALSGATNATLRLQEVQPLNAGSYSVRISNPVGTTNSSPATLTVANGSVPVAVVTQPQDVTITNGEAAAFTVTASGTAPIRYQWFFNATTPLAGATNSTLTLTAPTLAQSGLYSVRLTNAFGFATSSLAELRILVKPTITSLSLSNQRVTLTFNSLNRLRYTVESKPILSPSPWVAVPGATQLKGTGAGIVVSDPNPATGIRFYRILAE
jgi:subtilisin-like proprotein convertase family protein